MNELDQFKKNAGLDEAVTDFDQQARIDKVQSLEFDQAEKLIFNWVKASVINVREFSELNQANKDAV